MGKLYPLPLDNENNTNLNFDLDHHLNQYLIFIPGY